MKNREYKITDLLTSDGKRLNVDVDFTEDTDDFWVDYWGNNNYLGKIKKDPDSLSDGLRTSQYLLYRKKLPGLTERLVWEGMTLSSDVIITMMNFYNYSVVKALKDDPRFRPKVEKFMHTIYRIGGEIVFPQHQFSVNQKRGNAANDRFDLTLLCIQRYYEHSEDLPSVPLKNLLEVISNDSDFFDAFGSFKDYVDTFFLNDLVDNNYNTVLWIDNHERPKAHEYEILMEKQMEFLEKRSKRISDYEIN